MTDASFAAALAAIRFDDSGTEFETARSVTATETVGAGLAARARESGATAVASLVRADDAVLAHVVARELGVPRATIEEDLGLLTLSPRLPDGSRVAFVGLARLSERDLAAALTLLEGAGHTLTAPLFAASLQ